MTKLTLAPEARSMLRDLRAQADEFAQLPAKRMTREETRAFLDAAPVRGDDLGCEVGGIMEGLTETLEYVRKRNGIRPVLEVVSLEWINQLAATPYNSGYDEDTLPDDGA